MSWTKNNRIRCDICGVFCAWEKYDEWIPFGCADPGAPEPYDPEHSCHHCSEKEYDTKFSYFTSGGRSGDWQKSSAEVKAAKDAGLEWVGSNGMIDTRTKLDIHHRYILSSEKEYYAPYLEWLAIGSNRDEHKKAKDEVWKSQSMSLPLPYEKET